MIRWVGIIVTLVLATATAGCGTTTGAAPSANGKAPATDKKADGGSSSSVAVAPSPRVDNIDLRAFPSAVNWDDVPGPDGLRVLFYLWQNPQRPVAVALQRGTLEFVIYEGAVHRGEIADAHPFHVWRYTAAQLDNARSQTSVGAKYVLELAWGKHVPTTSTITLTARIPRPDRGPLYAEPMLLTVGAR